MGLTPHGGWEDPNVQENAVKGAGSRSAQGNCSWGCWGEDRGVLEELGEAQPSRNLSARGRWRQRRWEGGRAAPKAGRASQPW